MSDRRTFLARLGALVALSPLAAFRDVAARLVAACDPTSRTSEGPYYRAGAPFRTAIAEGVEGEPLVVTGRVVAGPDCEPVANAVLDVWQADANGKYDVNLTAADRAAYRLRGKVRTTEDGTFRFETIRPAPYPIGGGVRPAHIHVIVSAEGQPSVVTELFFEGDPHLASDPVAHVRPDLVHAVAQRDGALRLEHEFVLGV